MRYVGVDFGKRRIGLALSDSTGTLARPWETLAAAGALRACADLVAQRIAAFAVEDPDSAIRAVIVGLPRRLSGDDTDQTADVRRFATHLGASSSLPIYLQDERLTSHEADQRLSLRERDWRIRKKKLDAVAAAIVLQDYLDSARPAEGETNDRPC